MTLNRSLTAFLLSLSAAAHADPLLYAGAAGGEGAKVVAGVSGATFAAWPGSQLTNALEASAWRGSRFKGSGLGYQLSVRETEALWLQARLGAARTEARGAAGLGRTGLSSGLGIRVDLGEHWSFTLDYDRLKVALPGSSTVHMYTLGGRYWF